MQKNFFSMLFAIYGLTAYCGQSEITFANRQKDLGTFRLDLIQTTDFVFSNTGDAPLTIVSVTSDCGCTIADYPKEEIAPGDSAKITVRYNGRHRPTGSFTKQLKVRSNASNPYTRLILTGKSNKG